MSRLPRCTTSRSYCLASCPLVPAPFQLIYVITIIGAGFPSCPLGTKCLLFPESIATTHDAFVSWSSSGVPARLGCCKVVLCINLLSTLPPGLRQSHMMMRLWVNDSKGQGHLHTIKPHCWCVLLRVSPRGRTNNMKREWMDRWVEISIAH